jgi:hypothetical protein
MIELVLIVPTVVEVEGTPELAKAHHPTEFPFSIALIKVYEATASASLNGALSFELK